MSYEEAGWRMCDCGRPRGRPTPSRSPAKKVYRQTDCQTVAESDVFTACCRQFLAHHDTGGRCTKAKVHKQHEAADDDDDTDAAVSSISSSGSSGRLLSPIPILTPLNIKIVHN